MELPITAQAHNAECDFYEHVKGETVIPLPEVWYTQKVALDSTLPGLILMEDLSETAYCGKYEDGVSLDQIKTVVRHLARFHASQMARMGPSLADLEGISPLSVGYEKMFHAFIPKLIELDPYGLRPLIEKFTPLAASQFAEFALLKRHEELGMPTLLCHGDLWTSNVMLKKCPVGGETSEIAAFIDWQIIFHGNPLYDVARYAISADPEVRRQADSFIVQLYYDEVAKNVGEFGHSLPETFTLENVTQAYKLAFVHAAVTISYEPPLFAKTSRAAGMEEEAVEAQVAKLLARARAAIEDALKVAEEIAPAYIAG
ncbi:CRE-DHS-27 protein [Aphelenchoides avenae]|nr:CRE-DHS-27 protein [Aphelenchus avenae]